MKWQIVITVAALAAIFVGANVIDHDRAEKEAQESFSKAVRNGDKVYGNVCGACHDRYDPRFFMFDEWTRTLEDTGCPATRIELSTGDRESIKDFFRAKAAPTEEEAGTVQGRERARVRSDSAARGAENSENAGNHEVRWIRDYDKGMKQASEKKKPVIIDITDLSGG